MKQSKSLLLSFGFLTAILILIINDLYFKYVYHSFLTGKLSDIAGLFAFSFFFSVLFPKKKIFIHLLTFIGFVLWKLPIADSFIHFWNDHAFFKIKRVVDYTDYFALVILPISYWYKPGYVLNFENLKINKIVNVLVGTIAILSFIASSAGTHGNIKTYGFNYSKSDVNAAIKRIYMKDSSYVVPDFYKTFTWHYSEDRFTKDEWIREANADSVCFNIYIRNPEIIVWAGFNGFSDQWNDTSCKLALIGYFDIDKGKWKFEDDLSNNEKEIVEEKFEKSIINKLYKELGAVNNVK